MPEEITNTKEEIKALRNALRYTFEKEITDKNIQQYIFGPKGYNEDAIRQTNDYPCYFNNVLSLAFYFIYACYRCDMDRGYGDMDDLTSHNAKRIKNSLENALVRYPITTDLIQFVLTDIQFELAQGDFGKLKKVFVKLCVNTTEGFNFNTYFAVVAYKSRAEIRALFRKNVNERAVIAIGRFQNFGVVHPRMPALQCVFGLLCDREGRKLSCYFQ